MTPEIPTSLISCKAFTLFILEIPPDAIIGISGVIIGKAIYEKKFDLNNLIKLMGN